jgi:hypothetical protein
MNQKLQIYTENIKADYPVFLNYLKAKFPLFHNSNFFFRDFHYGIKKYFEKKGIKLNYQEAEKIAVELGKFLESEGIFVKIDKQAWKVNYQEFVTSQPGDPF